MTFSVNITVDGSFMTSHYRNKVSSIGLPKAVNETMLELGCSKTDAIDLIHGRKKIININNKLELVDEVHLNHV